ncbi:MAG TPA: response regulator [Deferrimonas sp.]|jgi:CheY-like chemotaxis protein
MPRILIIDDDRAFLSLFEETLAERYPALEVQTCADPVKALSAIDPDLDLLLVDLEMPGMDGAKILSYATEKGLSKNRIIILSGHDAEYLHRRFPMGRCLAVLNKHEVRQQGVLEMIFRSLHERSLKRAHADREKE